MEEGGGCVVDLLLYVLRVTKSVVVLGATVLCMRDNVLALVHCSKEIFCGFVI